MSKLSPVIFGLFLLPLMWLRITSVVIAVLAVGGCGLILGRLTAPPSAYQQMREADRRDLIQQKNLSKRDLELLGAPVR